MASLKTISAPAGMSGLAVEPWSKGEIYAVAADWAQASSPVLVYGIDGWTNDECGRQVADFRHRTRDALEAVIRTAIEMGGDEPDDDEVAAIMADAVELRDADLAAMAEMLDGHGDRFRGDNADDSAQDWIDNGFTAAAADEWCAIGVWNADTAAAFVAAGKTPAEISAACDRLIAAEQAEWDARDEAAAEDDEDWRPCDRDSQYTDGDPIYSACNLDTWIDVLIEACE